MVLHAHLHLHTQHQSKVAILKFEFQSFIGSKIQNCHKALTNKN
jgi:hypothetical protein